MQTISAKNSDFARKWYLIDAEGLVLGRLASVVARILRGKDKVNYTPHVDCGDHVVVINADKVHLTGKKYENKVYHRHTGFPGGVKSTTPRQILEGGHPERVIEMAVNRMITRNKLGRVVMGKLRVYPGTDHPHAAQNPEKLDVAAMNPKNKRRK